MALRDALLVGLLLAVSLAAGPVRPFAALPEGYLIRDVAADADGFVYVTGAVDSDAFVAKLSPDGAELLYRAVIGGEQGDEGRAIAVDAAGAAYVAVGTSSPELAGTPGAHQPIFGAESYQTLLVKLDAAGDAVYATFVGGGSNTSPWDVVVDAAGAAYVTGQSVGKGFPTTPGAAVASDELNTEFVAKIDPTGAELLVGVRGLGIGSLAVDAEGAIYVAGSAYGNAAIPVTPGAFQPEHELRGCGGTAWVGFACRYGYVVKLSPDGTEVLYGTFVTGSHGSSIVDLIVVGEGRALVAGTTNSRDFPTTPGALVEEYIAAKPHPPIGVTPHPPVYPPPSAGFVAMLNADGTDAVFSTYFGGTVQDRISGMRLTSQGILIAGEAESADLPGLDAPGPCLPAGYVAELAADGSAVRRTALLDTSSGARLETAGERLLATTGGEIVELDLDAPQPRIACITDAATYSRTDAAAPGSLLTLFGDFLVEGEHAGAPNSQGLLPTELGSMLVRIGDRPAPLLYASPTQVNVQVPFEAEPGETVELRDAYTIALDPSFVADEPRPLRIEERRPNVFLSPVQEPLCPDLQAFSAGGYSVSPLAFDEQGRLIECANPARQGSEVVMFLAGAGRNDPPLATGAITLSPPALLSPAIALDEEGRIEVLAAESLPGAVAGVWRIRFRIPGGDIGRTLSLEPTVDGARAQPGPLPRLFLWVDRPE